MTTRKAPCRADQVGSLLRSGPLKAARDQRLAHAITAAELTEIENAEITTLVRKQEAVGLKGVTDGDFAAPTGISMSLSSAMASHR